MTASPVATVGVRRLTTADNAALAALHARRVSAALIFAQETMNNRQDAAASAFADFYEASLEHQIAWDSASKRAGF